MANQLTTQCLECHFTRTLATARELGDEKTAMAFAKELAKLYVNLPENVASPHFGPATADLLTKYYGLDPDRYRQEKIDSNRFVMERFRKIQAQVLSQPDPVFAGLQFAILGNYLDFSALQGNVSYEKLDEMLASALQMQLDGEAYAALCRDLQAGNRLLYLTDNAGEIAFDRIFAEEIQKKYPHLAITFCVRGGPANNDALREDAEAVGVPFPVIDNGSRIGGTELEDISREALDAFWGADVVIAKGMGNTETLLGCGHNVYYAFLVKCSLFERLFQKPMFTPLLVREKSWGGA